ncbi:hypothetical protein DSO57_1033565 [Entomophthora muscae]|uniref:Uncharacterized protein n=1 Tax=Entomophthora muscae TaxID=34485 RepID=A0ACC2RQX0_9FUNG|nr:hypothetical protein DSO57_1033565 [Entomophthora muscae]
MRRKATEPTMASNLGATEIPARHMIGKWNPSLTDQPRFQNQRIVKPSISASGTLIPAKVIKHLCSPPEQLLIPSIESIPIPN